MLIKKGTRLRPYYCHNAKRTTKRRPCKPKAYIQRHTTSRILAQIIKNCINNNDAQTWERSNERFILPTNQFTTDNFKSTRKTYTQKIDKNLNPQK
jgi:hypothetical protein